MDTNLRQPTRTVDLGALEREVNEALDGTCRAILDDTDRRQHYASLFDRSSEEGFYGSSEGPKGEGEQPAWEPNPAYMDSLEEMWVACAEILHRNELELGEPLRKAFFSSYEYKDTLDNHRRVFTGHVVSTRTGIPITLYALTVPHSHRGFDYCETPLFYVSKLLGVSAHADVRGTQENR
jgi:hypothetical protein